MKNLVTNSVAIIFFAALGLGAFFGYREYKDHQFIELLERHREHLCDEARGKLLARPGVREVLGDCRFKPEEARSGVYAAEVSLQVRAELAGALAETEETRQGIRCVLISPPDGWRCDDLR